MKSNRIEWIDRWRGLLIISIVLFHVDGMAMIYLNDGLCKNVIGIVEKCLQSFHVVSFFAIAGLVWSAKGSFIEFVLHKAKRLLLPYFSWGVVMCLIFAIASLFLNTNEYYCNKMVNKGVFYSLVFADANRVIGPLWFLPALFVVELVYWFASKIINGRWMCGVAIAVCFGVYELFWRNKLVLPWSMNIVPYYLCFVFLAKLALPIRGNRWSGLKGKIVLPVLSILCLSIAWAFPLWDFVKGHMFSPYLAPVIFSSFGVLGTALAAQFISWRLLTVVGRASLGILVMHKFIIVGFQAVSPLVRFCFENGALIAFGTIFALSFIAVTIPTVATQLIRRRIPWMKWSIGEG